MAKFHTRQARKLRMKAVKTRRRATRPKTFKTEVAAKKYAEANKIASYKLVDLKEASLSKNKFRIIAE